jgi:hypothetical protein
MFLTKLNKTRKLTLSATNIKLLKLLNKGLTNKIPKKAFSEVCSKTESIKNSNEQEINNVEISLEKIDYGITDKSNVLFFDFQSTTPIDPRVLDTMLPYMTYQYGNPHSKSHEYGWNAEKAVETARKVNKKLN